MAVPAPPPGFTEEIETPAKQVPKAATPAAPEGFTEEVDPTGQSYLAGLGRVGLGQGMLMGFGDEILAGMRAIMGPETYKQALADERAKFKAFEKQNPKAAMAAELAGGIATPGLGMAGGAMKLASTGLGRAWQGAKIGAGFGTLGGIGASEGGDGPLADQVANVGKSAAIGTLVGGTIGAALPVVGGIAGGVVDHVRDAISPTLARRSGGVGAAADQVLANRLKRAELTDAQVAADLAGGRSSATLPLSSTTIPETLMDVSQSMQRLGGSVYRSGHKGGNDIQEFVASRQGGDPSKGLFGKQSSTAVPENQFERLVDYFKRATGTKRANLGNEIATIKNEQKVLGNADYKNAWATQDEFDLAPSLTSWSLRMKMENGAPEQSALKRAMGLFTRPDSSDPKMMALYARADDLESKIARAIEADKLDVADRLQRQAEIVNKQLENAHIKIGNAPFPVNNLERFDNAKRSLDGMISETKNNNVKRLLTQFKNDLLDAAHGGDRSAPTINKAYSEARDAWGSREALIEAADMGKKYMRGDGVTAADIKGLSKAEKRMFTRSAIEELPKLLGGKALGPTADFTNVLYQPNVYTKIRELIPQGVTSDKLSDLVRREKRISETAKETIGNSKTAQRAQDDIDFNSRDVLGAAYSAFRSQGGVINLGLDALKIGFEKMFGFREDMARELAKRLTTVDPAEQAQILARVAQRMGPDKTDKFLQFMANARMLGTAAGSSEINQSIAASRNPR